MSGRAACLAVVRLRGRVNINAKIENTFNLIHLTRNNHSTLLIGSPSSRGMLQKIKDYATWGEVSKETVNELLKKRGRLTGGLRLTDDRVKCLGYSLIEKLGNEIYEMETDLWSVPNLKPVFRLLPPRGGFRGSLKKHYPEGELGYRGEEINSLIAKMV